MTAFAYAPGSRTRDVSSLDFEFYGCAEGVYATLTWDVIEKNWRATLRLDPVDGKGTQSFFKVGDEILQEMIAQIPEEERIDKKAVEALKIKTRIKAIEAEWADLCEALTQLVES